MVRMGGSVLARLVASIHKWKTHSPGEERGAPNTNVDGESLPVELQPPDAARSDTMPLDYRDAGGRHVDGSKKTNETMEVACEPLTLPRGPYGGHVISRDCPRFVAVAIVTVVALVAFDLLPAMSSANSWTQVSNTARVVNGTTTFVSVVRFRGWATWSCLLLGLTAALLAQFFLLPRALACIARRATTKNS